MATRVLTEQDVDALLHLVIRGTAKATPTDGDWLIPKEVFAFMGPGDDHEDVFFRHRTGPILQLNSGARQALTALAQRLREHLQLAEAGDESLLRGELASAIGDVVCGLRNLKGLGGVLLMTLGARLARSVTVFPVAGLQSTSGGAPVLVRLGDRALLGALDDTTEVAVAQFAKGFVGHSLVFTGDAWWTEDLLAYRSEPEIFEDGPPNQNVTVIAIGVDAVGYAAAIRAKELAEAILGAIWLADQSNLRGALSAPPWILGGPNRAEAPRDPGTDFDGLTMVGLQVATSSGDTEPVGFEAGHPSLDVPDVLRKAPGLVELMVKAETPVTEQSLARRLAAACRFAWVSGQDTSFDLRVLHLVVALEALVSEHLEGAGVTRRFVSRLLALRDPGRRDSEKLHALYALRSEVGHQGFSASARSQLANATAYAHDVLTECVLGFVDAVKTHGFRTDTELLGGWCRTGLLR